MEPKTYKLVTLQDIVDQVPSDRIELCMNELGRGLAAAKLSLELVHAVSRNIAKEAGKDIPAINPGNRIMELPPLEWCDDGKGEIVMHMTTSEGQKELYSIENGELKIPNPE